MRMTAASFHLSAKVTFPEQKLEHQSGWGEPRLAMRLKTRLTVLVLPCDFSGSTAYPEHCLCNSSLPRGEQSPDRCLVIRKVAKVKRWLHGTDSSSPSPCLCFLLLEKGPIRSYRRVIFFFSKIKLWLQLKCYDLEQQTRHKNLKGTKVLVFWQLTDILCLGDGRPSFFQNCPGFVSECPGCPANPLSGHCGIIAEPVFLRQS